MYNITIWKDHAVTPANTYTVTENGDGTITLTPSGTVIQQGTNMSAANFNNIEEGVLAAGSLAAEAMNIARLADEKAIAFGVTVIEASFTNSQKYPFNDSKKTVALIGANVRDTQDYTVDYEPVSVEGGLLGDVVITDKMVNGFKAAYTGSATSATLKLYVRGGN